MRRLTRRNMVATLAAGLGLFALGLLGIEARAQQHQEPPAIVIHGDGQDV